MGAAKGAWSVYVEFKHRRATGGVERRYRLLRSTRAQDIGSPRLHSFKLQVAAGTDLVSGATMWTTLVDALHDEDNDHDEIWLGAVVAAYHAGVSSVQRAETL